MALTKVSRGLLSTGIVDNSTTTAITIDSSENVGIGNSNPSAFNSLGATDKLVIGDSTDSNLTLFGTTYGSLAFADSDTSSSTAQYAGLIQYYHSDNSMQFYTNATERMRIDSSGNVGIGTSSPRSILDLDGGSETQLRLQTTNSGSTTSDGLLVSLDSSANAKAYIWNYENAEMIFGTNATERMRINSTAQVLIGTTTKISSDQSNGALAVHGNTTASGAVMEVKNTGNPASGRDLIRFYNTSNGEAGSIEHNGTSSVAYLTSSDYRLKENVDYDWDATTRLKQLKPARFNFIADGLTTVDGFLAHEVSSVVPEAVSGAKDAMYAEVLYVEGDELPEGKVVGDVKIASTPNMQGIDQSKLVPLLVKAIQEQQATIEALTQRIETLENN